MNDFTLNNNKCTASNNNTSNQGGNMSESLEQTWKRVCAEMNYKDWLELELKKLQSAHDKLKARVSGAQRTETDENGFLDVNYFLNTNGEPQTIALVELTPEEMEGDEPHSLENPKESVQRD